MQIKVKTLTGYTININVESSDTIASLKMKIFEREGVQPEKQLLIFERNPIEDDKLISDYTIH